MLLSSPYKTRIDTSALFSMQIEYWILTCKVLDPMPTISAYSAIFPPSYNRVDVRRCVFYMDPLLSADIDITRYLLHATIQLEPNCPRVSYIFVVVCLRSHSNTQRSVTAANERVTRGDQNVSLSVSKEQFTRLQYSCSTRPDLP